MFEQKEEKYQIFSTEKCHFYSFKNRCILHRRVCVLNAKTTQNNLKDFVNEHLTGLQNPKTVFYVHSGSVY